MKFVVPTTATVERSYHVEADDPEQAHARMRMWLDDQDALKEGVVSLHSERNKTDPKVNIAEIKQLTPQVVKTNEGTPPRKGAAA